MDGTCLTDLRLMPKQKQQQQSDEEWLKQNCCKTI